MKKILNDPANFVNEMMDGIFKAYPNYYKCVDNNLRTIVREECPIKDKVAIATGGGSGHLPVFMGYVGDGLIDGASIGNVFSSPSVKDMLKVSNAINSGKGILYLYGRYQGDMMNFDTAADMLRDQGIQVETVLVTDDIASSPRSEWQKRRGVAGIFFAYKIAGAKAAKGASLQEVKEVTEKTISWMGTLGIALTPCILPAVGKPTFSIGEDEMEIGMGIHGEAGVARTKMKSADEIAKELVYRVLEDMPELRGEEVAVLVNSLGGTPLEELFILYRKVFCLLENENIKIYRNYIGRYACSMEMQGASLTLLKLDSELKELLDYPANSPFFTQV